MQQLGTLRATSKLKNYKSHGKDQTIAEFGKQYTVD